MVLDASAVVEWLLGSVKGDQVAAELRRDPGGIFFAPDLLDVEVVHAFRLLARTGVITEARASGAVALLERLPVERRPAGALVPRIWDLRANLSTYAAAYVALAEAVGAAFVTADVRLAAAVRRFTDVEVIEA